MTIVGFRQWTACLLGALLCLLLPGQVCAVNPADLLSNEQAFRLSSRIEKDVVILNWDIADGYHLYQKRLKFTSKTPGVGLGEALMPKGETKHDDAMGVMEIYRGHVQIKLPLRREAPGPEAIQIEVSWQGCADAGVCYTPVRQVLTLNWPTGAATKPPAETKGTRMADVFSALGLKPKGQGDLLPPDQAFRYAAEVKDGHTLWVSWRIADGYYLYREKFGFALNGPDGVALAAYQIPHGEPKQDPEFGPVEILRGDIGFALPLQRSSETPLKIELKAAFQGCADRGVCYPPMEKVLSFDLPAAAAGVGQSVVSEAIEPAPLGECEIGPATGFVETDQRSEQCAIVDGLKQDTVWLTAASFLGMGLLLAFTPCIFPMIPILSGIIVGHGHKITTGRAFALSLSYVLASALAYTVFGVLAALFGHNLQALLQEPRVIVAFSAVFVLLALSMFDLFTLQLPGFIQNRIASLSHQQHGGTLTGAAVMGALSALIVGPCVAAPLAGALIYIGQTGDALLGGMALFALGLGMGIPLLVIGASAGKLLPRAGIWMNAVKAVFGVGLLAIATWLLERVLPPAATLLLWALLLIVPAIFMGALDTLPETTSGWRKLWKGLGIAMLAYGILLLIGVASNSTDPLQPLRGVMAVTSPGGEHGQAKRSLTFEPVNSERDLDRALAEAAARGQRVMLDFYADWCVSCKEMERYTFTDPAVIDALSGFRLLKADVTDNTAQHTALMQRFSLVGPPATLFFGPDGQELKSLRVIGYVEADDFRAHIGKVGP